MMDGMAPASLPRVGAAREKLREKGQFWTPDWVADALVAWAAKGSDHIFDPGVGSGAFFRAGKRRMSLNGRPLALTGCELDRGALNSGLGHGLEAADLERVIVGDFMAVDFGRRFQAVVANPPYVRHHRFPAEYKAALGAFGTRLTGQKLDGRAGLHVFFLMKALTLLEDGGRLAFIVPADICEGRFAPALWRWIGREYRIEGAVTFAPGASPFPGVDTNPIVLLISKAPPAATMRWAHVLRADTKELLAWCEHGLPIGHTTHLEAVERNTSEALATGLTRRPVDEASEDTVSFGHLFKVLRGVATGDNGFFFMTFKRAKELGLPENSFLRAIGRTRDHSDGANLTLGHLDELDRQDRPTYLLSLDRTPCVAARRARHLHKGEGEGLPSRPLIAQRKPWYRMETRQPPPWLFAYLGRRSCRFIRNQAGAVPLTGFLCVYPQQGVELDFAAATAVLNDERTLANLGRVAKSYGGGALKVEPRNLERLPIPRVVLAEHGLNIPQQREMYGSSQLPP